MKCPGCGAAMSSAMLEQGDCPYCGTALPKDPSADLAKAIERLADQPKVVQVTRVELRGPDIQVAGLFDSVTARIAGCFTGCLSMAITVGITFAILGFSAWQVWMQTRHLPSPPSPPAIEQPKAPDHGKPGKRR